MSEHNHHNHEIKNPKTPKEELEVFHQIHNDLDQSITEKSKVVGWINDRLPIISTIHGKGCLPNIHAKNPFCPKTQSRAE